MSEKIEALGLDELDETAAIIFREKDELCSFAGDYGPTDEQFRQVARGTLFAFDDNEIVVVGDFNGHVVFRRIDNDNLGMITWRRLVEEYEPVAENWIEMPE